MIDRYLNVNSTCFCSGILQHKQEIKLHFVSILTKQVFDLQDKEIIMYFDKIFCNLKRKQDV